MEKLLVTGAHGFIGLHVVEAALARGLKVVAFDRYGDPSHYPEGVDLFLGDLQNPGQIAQAVRGVDYAINLGGILGTQETIYDPVPAVQDNIIGALNFFTACVPTPFYKVKAVQIGVGNHWMNNPYSISKSTAVRFAYMFNKERGTKIAVVRALNVYGERQKHAPVRKVVPAFVVKALRGEDIQVYGSGNQIMDMIYVEDVANILIDAAVNDHGQYETDFEAGTGEHTTVNYLAQKIIEAAGSKSKLVNIPMRKGEEDDAIVVGDPATLAPLGDYKLARFEDKIEQVVRWYRDNYDWKKD